MNLSRQHPDPLADLDAPLVIDRQRVIHAAAFRRLQYKAQVFIAADDDHFRTRLTHTLEVANLARRIADNLGLDARLAEIVALAHDLGHPPFGHAGERALNECMAAFGGFEHNTQSLRVVEFLEHPYPEFRGLNLTHVVRECLAKHETPFDHPAPHALRDGRPAPAEGIVADLADRLAYGLHDLQDGLYSGLIEPAALRDVRIWRQAGGGDGAAGEWRSRLRPTIDRMQRALLDDVTSEWRRRESAAPGATPHEARAKSVGLSEACDEPLRELEAVLRRALYRHPRLVEADQRGATTLRELFDAYVRRPEHMGPRYVARIADAGLQRVVADYIAGMTDRYCIAEHTRLCS